MEAISIGIAVFFVISLAAALGIIYIGAVLRAGGGLQDRRMKGFFGLCMIVPVWIILTAANAVVTRELYPLFYVLKAIFLDIVPFASVWFLLNFIEFKAAGSRAVRYTVVIMPVLAILSLLTNPLHNLHILSYDEPPVTGPLFLVHLVLSLACLFITYILLFRYIIRNYRKSPLLTLSGIGALVPVILYLLYLFLPSVIRHDITPIGYAVTIILFAYTASAPRLRNYKPGTLGNTLGVIAKSQDISSGNVKSAARKISQEGCTALGAYRVRIWNYDTQEQTLSCVACYSRADNDFTDQDDFDMKGIEGFGGYLASSRVLAIDDVAAASASLGIASIYDPEVCAVLMAPICMAGIPIGLICIEQDRCRDYPEKREWTEEEQSFAASLADLLSITIVNTERLELLKVLEDDLTMSRNLTRAVTEANPTAYLMTDGSFKLIDCNDAALRMFGCPDKSYFLSCYWDKFSPELQPDGQSSKEKARIFNEKVLKGETCVYEWMHTTYDGEPLPVENVLTLIPHKNKKYVVSYKHDLRRIQKVEKMLRESADRERSMEIQREAAQLANEAKTRLLANMSHEIRTPMHVITGMSDLLLSEELSFRQHQYAQDIKTSAEALLGIINDILDISKIQAAKLTLMPVHYHFKTFIDNVISVGKYLIRDKGLGQQCGELLCCYEIDENIPEYLYGDDMRLRQIYLNLLSNAVKYSDEGSVTMTIKMEDGNMLTAITDTGRGIPQEDIPILFDAFERIDEARTRNKQGTGLGLAITKSLVELMGGRIWCESVYGEGSTFYFTIPVIPGDPAQVAREQVPEPVYAQNANVLIVDDKELNLKVIHDILRQCGIEADCAISGAQALEMVRQSPYDLIFMDHMMPDMDGIETTEALRAGSFDMPVVALTANAISGARESLLSAGMNDFLSKPINKPELFRVLRQWLPPEKIKASSSTGSTQEDEGDDMNNLSTGPFWDEIAKIRAISVSIGLSTAGGNRNDYKNTLQILARETGKSVISLPGFLNRNDLKGFCTEAHGIKGALHLAGAISLSAKARDLENASRNGDIQYCKDHLKEFTDALTALGKDLKSAFEKSDSMQSKPAYVVPPQLHAVLTRLRNAVDRMDLDVIFSDIDKLSAMSFAGELGREVKSLTEALQIMNYDQAKSVIKRLIG